MSLRDKAAGSIETYPAHEDSQTFRFFFKMACAFALAVAAAIPAASQVTNLEVTESGDDIVISWATGIGPYRVFASGSPDFYFANRIVQAAPALSPVSDTGAAALTGGPSGEIFFYTVLVAAEGDPGGFSVNPPPSSAPVITTLSPDSGPPGTEVVVTGTGFPVDGSLIATTFHGVPADVDPISATEIHAVVPADAVSGEVRVCVASDSCSNALPFQVTFGPQFQDITSISYEAGTGSLWVADRGTANHVYEIDTSGTMTTRGTVVGAILSHPTLPDNNGRIFFSQSADGTGGIVHYVDSATNADVNFETGGPTPVRCEGIAARSSQPGVAYLLNSANNLIRQVIDGPGNNVDNFGNFTFNFNRPAGARFDSQNNLYVTSTTKIYRITPAPTVTTTEVASGFTAAAGLDLFEIGGVAYLVVADESEGNIYLVKPLGDKAIVYSGFQGPVGVALAASSLSAVTPALYVAEPTRIIRLPNPVVEFEETKDQRVLLSRAVPDDDFPSREQREDGKIFVWARLSSLIDPTGRTAYFRLLDPPDRSGYVSAITPDDNLPSSPNGDITVAAPFGPSGEAVAVLNVGEPTHPGVSGNNFRVEVSLTDDPDFRPLATSPLYTTWRRNYIEYDKMWKEGAWIRAQTTPGSPTPTEIEVSNSALFSVGDRVHVLSGDTGSTASGEFGLVTSVDAGSIHVEREAAPGQGLLNSYSGHASDDVFPYGFVARTANGEYSGDLKFDSLPKSYSDAFTEWRVLPSRGHVPNWPSPPDPEDTYMLSRSPRFFNARRAPSWPERNTLHVISAASSVRTLGAITNNVAELTWIFEERIALLYPSQTEAARYMIAAHEFGHQFNVNQSGPGGHDGFPAWSGETTCMMKNPLEPDDLMTGIVRFHALDSSLNDLMCIRTHGDDVGSDETCLVP